MGYIKHRSEESVEDYLETILILSKRLGNVRSIDIANEMNFSKPSVSVAMKNLRNSDCITVSKEGYILLTEKGQSIAKTVYEKHTCLTQWLIHLGVDPEVAKTDACKMEHDISEESFVAIKKHIHLTK
ncbi:MAG: metal-dependent transcriptional regulator [Dorea sp.]|nr:metal-dependent transcriptional regulator [Dorea sp.]